MQAVLDAYYSSVLTFLSDSRRRLNWYIVWAQGTTAVHTSATWQIRLNDECWCAAMMTVVSESELSTTVLVSDVTVVQ